MQHRPQGIPVTRDDSRVSLPVNFVHTNILLDEDLGIERSRRSMSRCAYLGSRKPEANSHDYYDQ